MYVDAHLHIKNAVDRLADQGYPDEKTLVCASSCTLEEFEWHEAFARTRAGRVYLSHGIHPQQPLVDHAALLDSLCQSHRLDAIGEAGFDLFTPENRATLPLQRAVWDLQLDLAHAFSLPLIIHCRKGMDLIFADSRRLKKLRAIIFHGWPGSAIEAQSLLARGINAWFSAGKGLLRGDRSLIETVRTVPPQRLLSETDAPWMQMKGEVATHPHDIRAVVALMARIRQISPTQMEGLLELNFRSVFPGTP